MMGHEKETKFKKGTYETRDKRNKVQDRRNKESETKSRE